MALMHEPCVEAPASLRVEPHARQSGRGSAHAAPPASQMMIALLKQNCPDAQGVRRKTFK